MKDLLRIAFALMLLTAAGFTAQGQDAHAVESSSLVMYDPIFWKSKLRLREDQCRSIRKINAQYYDRLTHMPGQPGDERSGLMLVEQYLSERNEQIWGVFQPVQRKRWKRLWHHQYAARVRNPHASDGAQSSLFRPELLIRRLL